MITFRKLEHTIAGTVDGKPFNAPRTEQIEAYLVDAMANNTPGAEVLAHLKATRNQEIAGSNKYLAFNPVTEEYFLELEGKRSKHPIPKTLVKFIEDSFEKKVDFMPVVKAWARLLANPRYNKAMGKFFSTYLETSYVDRDEVAEIVKEQELDIKIATKMATYQDIAITQEGLLATYKVANIVTWQYEMELQEDGEYKKVRNHKYKLIADKLDPTTGDVLEKGSFEKPDHLEDFQFTPAIYTHGDKFFSGDKIGYVYEVGKIQYLPKDAKRNLKNEFGGGGLYSGGLHYIENYKGAGSHILTCFVNPSDILSFQSEGQAFRTDALMPNNVWDETIPLKGTYHSSDYGKTSEIRVEALIKEAIEAGIDLSKDPAEQAAKD
jgi:hypothetical protein